MAKKEKGKSTKKGWAKRSRIDRRNSTDMVWHGKEKRKKTDRRKADFDNQGDKKEQRNYPVIPKVFKIRTIYFKVSDMEKAKNFYRAFLEIEPHKEGNVWCEFKLSNINFGLRLNDFSDKWEGSNFVPVFEFMEQEIFKYIMLAKKLGAAIVTDALEDSQMLSVVMRDPFGNEFEISKFHD